ncbi:MAG: hypothetical protein ACE5KH_06515 [Candidatus Geothermarchaeales archaeon]
MVSWGRAFWKGFVILLWTMVWAIVGGIVMALSMGAAIFGVLADPTYFFLSSPGLLAGAGLIGFIIGTIIVALGSYAAIVKVTVDTAREELRSSSA